MLPRLDVRRYPYANARTWTLLGKGWLPARACLAGCRVCVLGCNTMAYLRYVRPRGPPGAVAGQARQLHGRCDTSGQVGTDSMDCVGPHAKRDMDCVLLVAAVFQRQKTEPQPLMPFASDQLVNRFRLPLAAFEACPSPATSEVAARCHFLGPKIFVLFLVSVFTFNAFLCVS